MSRDCQLYNVSCNLEKVWSGCGYGMARHGHPFIVDWGSAMVKEPFSILGTGHGTPATPV